MSCDKVLYAELTPQEFRQRIAEAPIAYLPLGTLEWHGEHLPLGSDGLQSQGFFVELAKRAGGVVLPMLFLGPDRKQEGEQKTFYGMDIFGFSEEEPQQLDGSAYWIDDALYRRLIEAILEQLKRAGFRVVVAHGHGPSTGNFRQWIPELSGKYGLKLFVAWREDESDGLGIQTDHAAANETSLMMALRPELVQMERLSSDPDVWPVAVGGQDPRSHASVARGQRSVEIQVTRMAALLTEACRSLQ